MLPRWPGAPDPRVDFPNGAIGPLGFGFDDFESTFGSTEVPAPAGALLLMGLGLLLRRRAR